MNENTHPKLYGADPILYEIDPKRTDLFVPVSFPSSERDFDVDELIRDTWLVIERDIVFGMSGSGRGRPRIEAEGSNR